jgi:hypothetical protein
LAAFGAPHLNPSSLFTTNYDELVELGYAGNGKVVDVICNNRTPVSGRPVIFKPHGSLSHANVPIGEGGLVITQFDYFEMIGDYREMLQKIIKNFGTQACWLLDTHSGTWILDRNSIKSGRVTRASRGTLSFRETIQTCEPCT